MRNRAHEPRPRRKYGTCDLPSEPMKEIDVEYLDQPPNGEPHSDPPEHRYMPPLRKGADVPDPNPSPPVEFGKPVYLVPREHK
jgi:hypothetical protein